MRQRMVLLSLFLMSGVRLTLKCAVRRSELMLDILYEQWYKAYRTFMTETSEKFTLIRNTKEQEKSK